jgi:hypothetical protein
MSTTTYSTGTVSVGAGSTSVTGVGTSWLTAGIRAGDRLVLAGLTARIATVNSNTSITLARGWPGSAQSGADYDIWLEDDGVRSLVAANALLQALGAGTLTSLGSIAGAANLMPYFTGAGVMDTTGLTAAARGLLDDADVAAMRATLELVKTTSDSDVTAGRVILTGAGPAQAYRRGNILGTVSEASGVPTGAVIERGSNANGEYVRFADGTQICWGTAAVTSRAAGSATIIDWTYPAAFSALPYLYPYPRSFNLDPNAEEVARHLSAGPRGVSNSAGRAVLFNRHTSAINGGLNWRAEGRWF